MKQGTAGVVGVRRCRDGIDPEMKAEATGTVAKPEKRTGIGFANWQEQFAVVVVKAERAFVGTIAVPGRIAVLTVMSPCRFVQR